MATGRGDGPNRPDAEEWEDERSRSLLNATWFRLLVVVVVVAAVAAVAVPYVMELTSTPRPVARVPAAPPKQDAPTSAAPPPQTSTPAVTATAPAAPPPPAAPTAPAAPAAPPAASQPAAPAAQAQKPEPQKAEPAPARPDAPMPAPKRTGARQPQATKPAPAGSGDLWVQVGAFRDQATAQRLAATLKEKGFNATESTTTPRASAGGGKTDRYAVVVSGAQSPELVQKLSAKGLSAEHTADGAIIRPSLPLRDAISLSNDLRTEGFKVTVRRVGGGAAPAPAARTGETLHRVRVGAFPDRAAAREAAQKLEALGYKPFIAQGP